MLARRSAAVTPCAVARPSTSTRAPRAASKTPASSPSATILQSSPLAVAAPVVVGTLASSASDASPRGLAKLFTDALQPQADFFSTLGLPEWLVHWGHPGNMAGEQKKSGTEDEAERGNERKG